MLPPMGSDAFTCLSKRNPWNGGDDIVGGGGFGDSSPLQIRVSLVRAVVSMMLWFWAPHYCLPPAKGRVKPIWIVDVWEAFLFPHPSFPSQNPAAKFPAWLFKVCVLGAECLPHFNLPARVGWGRVGRLHVVIWEQRSCYEAEAVSLPQRFKWRGWNGCPGVSLNPRFPNSLVLIEV